MVIVIKIIMRRYEEDEGRREFISDFGGKKGFWGGIIWVSFEGVNEVVLCGFGERIF